MLHGQKIDLAIFVQKLLVNVIVISGHDPGRGGSSLRNRRGFL